MHLRETEVGNEFKGPAKVIRKAGVEVQTGEDREVQQTLAGAISTGPLGGLDTET